MKVTPAANAVYNDPVLTKRLVATLRGVLGQANLVEVEPTMVFEDFAASWITKVQLVFAERHAAAIKHTVIRVEKAMGVVKAYLQLKAVTATKQMASAQAMLRTRAKVSAGSPLSSQATTAANKRNTEKKNPNALKKSQ